MLLFQDEFKFGVIIKDRLTIKFQLFMLYNCASVKENS